MNNTNNLIEHLVIDEEEANDSNVSPQNSKAIKAKQRYKSQERILKGSNIFSRIFFHWISCLLSYGKLCSIETDDLPKLHQSMHPKIQFQSLHNSMIIVQKSPKPGWTLLKAISHSYCKSLGLLGILALIITAFTMTGPVLTHMIITFVKKAPEDRSWDEGIWITVGIVLITLGKAVLQSHLYYQFAVFGFNLSNTLSLLIYEKSLKYPALCEKKYSVSQIINYSQVDAQRMTNMGVQLTSVLYTPLQIIIGIYLMYSYIGVSFGTGLLVMSLMITSTFFIAKQISRVNEDTLKFKDKRMKVTQQILDIIRFIKINAIQKYFFKRLDEVRGTELNSNRKRGFLEVLIVFLYFLNCPLIIFVTFITYILLGNDIDSTVAFSTIMIFNILQSPLRQFPSALSSLIQMYTSIKRIEQFLLSKEITYNHIRNNSEKEDTAIEIENGTFCWGNQQKIENEIDGSLSQQVIQYRKSHAVDSQQVMIQDQDYNQYKSRSIITSNLQKSGKFISDRSTDQFNENQEDSPSRHKTPYISAIKGVNITIKKQQFVMVLGDIGSGKSSFLLGLLNEMKCTNSSIITIKGSVAYAAQKPWIMHGTVRENILFSKAFEKKKFQQCLQYSSLKKDLKLFVKGQFTQIGQKGVNLSGGQKARISLARAIYSQRDILLLDDIISAVDVHVGQFLIKDTILKYLKGKTIVMATHAANFAEYADQIIVLKKGCIVRKGAFKDIYNTPEFKEVYESDLYKKQSKESQDDKKINNDQKKMKQTLNLIKQVKENKRSLVISRGNKTKSFAEKAIEDLMIPEDHNKGEIDLTVIKQYIRQNGGIVFALIVLGSMGGWVSLSLFSNIQLKQWCADEQHSNYYLYVYLALSVSASLCAFIRAYTLVLSGFKQGELVHKKIIQSLLYASLNQFYSRVPVGRIMNRLTKDLRQVDETIGYSMGSFLTNFFSLIGTLSICIYGSTPYMIIPTIIVIFLCNRLRKYYMNTQRQVIRIQAKTNSPIVSGFVSTIHGLATIRAYKVQEQFLQMQIKRIQTNKAARITRQALQSWFAFRLTLLSFFISIVSIIFALVNKDIEPALVGLLLSYAFNLNDDIISLTFSWANLQTRMISVERIYNFMKIEAQKPYQDYCKDWNSNEQGFKKIIQNGVIEFKNVNARYREDLPYSLKGVTFKIDSGQKVGIVGRTGAGKSTIYNTLLRIIDISEGQILIDNCNYQSFNLKDLRYAVTMIDQEPVLIKATFRQNLDLQHKYADQELYQILKQCNLYETIMSKNGLDGVVNNNSLSAGQKQLLCICRAFLKSSKIVIIDEATANIDSKNDEMIQKTIKQKFRKSTVLTIAHRLSTLKQVDKIIVMGEGKVIEWGSPSELQRKGGIYAEMLQKNGSQLLV